MNSFLPDTSLPAEPKPPDRGSLGQGFAKAAVWNIFALIGSFAAIFIMIGIPIFAAFGLVQFAWLIPVRRRYLEEGKTESAKGVDLAVGLTFLLNAGCWGVLLLR